MEDFGAAPAQGIFFSRSRLRLQRTYRNFYKFFIAKKFLQQLLPHEYIVSSKKRNGTLQTKHLNLRQTTGIQLKLKPEPGKSDCSGSSQITRLQNPGWARFLRDFRRKLGQTVLQRKEQTIKERNKLQAVLICLRWMV